MTFDPDLHPAVSSRQQLSAPAQPLRSRYNLGGGGHRKEKERYAAKEREELVRKAREKRMAEIMVGPPLP